MKFILLMTLTLCAFASYAMASSTNSSKKSSNLRTDIRFSGTEVGGKYQVAGEAVATVENEKPMIDLIQPRREFKDRLKKSVTQ